METDFFFHIVDGHRLLFRFLFSLSLSLCFAERIADAFGSFAKLMESYCSVEVDAGGKRALLRDLMVSERRSVGPAVSTKCFEFFTTTDEDATI